MLPLEWTLFKICFVEFGNIDIIRDIAKRDVP